MENKVLIPLVYLQHQYKTDKISTQLGVRLEDNEKFGTHTVGQGAIRYFLLPTTSIYANIGTAFRAPSLSELYYFYENPAWNYYSYGNQNLKPEESSLMKLVQIILIVIYLVRFRLIKLKLKT